MELTFKKSLDDIFKSSNLTNEFSDEDLETIGREVVREYEMDLQSREGWEKRINEAMKLALQVVETKSFPWPNASNVKFPLITIAALQFHARAYPALIPGKDLVRVRVNGEDTNGDKSARAKRVENHMSFQVLEQDENWEEQMDKVLITTPIVGCSFKKTYYSSRLKRNVSEMVLAKDLVVDYWTKSLDTATRITHRLYPSSNDIREKIVRGMYRDVDLGKVTQIENDETRDKAQGISPDAEDPDNRPLLLEQQRYMDLDGDGYKEPYIVTVHKETKTVLRIVPNFFSTGIEKVGNKVAWIKPETYFTKYGFIPSPDGGFYDLGFGVLLGPLNASIDTLINQLIDAGTMANTAGGFLGRGLKIRGGNHSFAPLEWKHVETTGDDIRKNIFPLPVREPSQVLYTLLELLINYGERIGSATEMMVGENPGQNTPAETSRTMVEQGMKIFSGIFKRIHRSLKEEFRKLYRLNQLYLDVKTTYSQGKYITLDDYIDNPEDVTPVSDPNIVSDSQRLMQAQAILQAAHSSPGYNLYEANLRYLEALKVPNIEKLFPDPQGPNAVPPQPNPKIQVEQIKAQVKQMDIQAKVKLRVAEISADAEKKNAEIMVLQAQAMKLMAEAKGVGTGHEIALLNAQIGAAKQHRDHMLKTAEVMLKAVEIDKMEPPGDNSGGVQ
jgi:chaperonin GroES